MEQREPLSRGSTERFRKRTHSAESFLTGCSWIARNLPRLVRATFGNRIDSRFREKLLLTVTATNECRYCVRFHTSMASSVGLDDEAIGQILAADIEAAVLESERPALLFALHYAETDGDPDPELLTAVATAYDPAMAADIVILTRTMHFVNLLGNTVDAAARTAEHRLVQTLRHARARCPI